MIERGTPVRVVVPWKGCGWWCGNLAQIKNNMKPNLVELADMPNMGIIVAGIILLMVLVLGIISLNFGMTSTSGRCFPARRRKFRN